LKIKKTIKRIFDQNFINSQFKENLWKQYENNNKTKIEDIFNNEKKIEKEKIEEKIEKEKIEEKIEEITNMNNFKNDDEKNHKKKLENESEEKKIEKKKNEKTEIEPLLIYFTENSKELNKSHKSIKSTGTFVLNNTVIHYLSLRDIRSAILNKIIISKSLNKGNELQKYF
jgi:hypothetical protein